VQGNGARQLRIYLVDDHDLVRRGLRDLLAPSRQIDVVGETSSAVEAVPAIMAAEPDVMLLDLHLQDGTGIGICRKVRADKPQVQAVLLTAARDDVANTAAVLAGAAGCLYKLDSPAAIRDALRRAGTGRSLMDRDHRERIVADLTATADESTLPSDTDREVLLAMIAGRSDPQIMAQLGLTRDELDEHLDVVIESVVGIESRRS
jgi:two-component system response regulator DevR